ncbi:MAG: Heat-inducible transcription repressor HrcA, partial [uncultured Solirubrobacteraceae bacterium]
GAGEPQPATGAPAAQGRRRLPRHGPARGLQGPGGRRGARLRVLDDPPRARDARRARAARAPPHQRGPGADRRGAPLLRRPAAADGAGARRARNGPRAAAHPPRGRRGDARHDRDALPGHEPAGDRLRAADQHGDDPPHRGAAAAAPGRHGRRHHLHGRGDQARLRLRVARGPGSGHLGGRGAQRTPERGGPRRPDAALAPERPLPRRDGAHVPRGAESRLHRPGRHRGGRALRRRCRPPADRAPLPGPHPDQRADGDARAARHAARGPASRPRGSRRARAHRLGERGARAPGPLGHRRGLRPADAAARDRLGHRPRPHGLRRGDPLRPRGGAATLPLHRGRIRHRM